MIAREWKATCPKKHKKGFIEYLYETGVKDTSKTKGFLGAQILSRNLNNAAEITLVTFWEDLECIKAFAGENIDVARLYPEDTRYNLKPDRHVNHYQVCENIWV